MDKNKTLMNWLLQCPSVTELYALYGKVEDKAHHFIRQEDIIKTKYTDGTREIHTNFTINCFSMVTFDLQDIEVSENLDNYALCQSICDWVKAQGISKNYPILPCCIVHDIKPIPENPQVAGVDTSGIAKYMIGVRLEYTEL